METSKLKKFAQFARRTLIAQVSTKLELVLTETSAARRENPDAIKKLKEKISSQNKEQVIEQVAYIWFNRFCALRFMDLNRYNRVNVVSPADPGQFQPEILSDAKMGHIDEEMLPDKVRNQILALLDDKAPSRDPQGEAYRLLVVATCNFWNKTMSFLFQRIDDYTELLMPDDLLSGNSILAYTREAMTPDACKDVEVIGWLYQFYISEKKDEVFDGLKKNKKITSENIPAATQLFTPHWIVRYLVENSLGRLWMLNHSSSKLIEQMDYYIKPEQTETDFLRINTPEEIKICDPACGSGHMLTYAFDLLYAIYEEEGYDPTEIPEKILTNNLYGIEIDERAGELAAFALTMKARNCSRRFFRRPVKPHICILKNVKFDDNELTTVITKECAVACGASQEDILHDLTLFEEADNFGSLVRPCLTSEQCFQLRDYLTGEWERATSHSLFDHKSQQNILQALEQADYLSQKYHVVIANPPYMGGKGMNARLTTWAKNNYPNSKSDLFAMFIERNLDLAQKHGAVAMITMHSWMFLSSFETMRARILGQSTLLSMAHLGARAFDSIGGEVVSTTAFVLERSNRLNYKGYYLRLITGNSEAEKDGAIRKAITNPDCSWFYRASATDFKKIPGRPIAYWLSQKVFNSFEKLPRLSSIAPTKQGLATGDNNRFLRRWQEPNYKNISFDCKSSEETINRQEKWYPCNKGGEFRKWYGNNNIIVNWENAGKEIKNFFGDNGRLRSRPQNESFYFQSGLTWSALSNASLSMRFSPSGTMFETKGAMCFPKENNIHSVLAFLNTKIVNRLLLALSPTLDFHEGPVGKLPYAQTKCSSNIGACCAKIAKSDWDSYETSWDFTKLPLLNPDYSEPTLKATYQKLRSHWREMTLEMQRLEEENNRIFIEAYGLQNELTPEVPLNEITLTCNPHYRYGRDKSDDELEALLQADTIRELISYAVGCMFGRYSLDKPGLILANQGEAIEDYLTLIPEPSFPPDEDNVIPILDGDWFTDDITERFCKFLKVAFGDEHYEKNLKFIEEALGKKGKRQEIRDYFLKDFYNDHVKRYKKRPIYWMFSSPKGSFNALIYMHRYRPDTVSIVLNDYLREFRTKLTAHKQHLEAVSISSNNNQSEKTKALKEIEKITKMISEVEDYEREVLYPLATQKVEIDLDDGVKVNYTKFKSALKKIPGLDTKDD